MKRDMKDWLFIAVICLPSVAMANTGTVFMMGHSVMLLGNLVIGLSEGLLLALILKKPVFKIAVLLVLANYFSFIAGGILVSYISDLLPLTISNAMPLTCFMVFVCYLITLILEFPFVAFAVKKEKFWSVDAVAGSFFVQSLSYIVLIIWYGLISSVSFMTVPELVESSEMSLPREVTMYYIKEDDGNVYMGNLFENEWHKVYGLNSTNRMDRLMVHKSVQYSNKWEIAASHYFKEKLKDVILPISGQLASVAVPLWERDEEERIQYYWLPWIRGSIPKLGNAVDSQWTFHAGYWPTIGLRGEHASIGKDVRLSAETLFFRWKVRNAVHLPTDKILFQLGENQICIFDPETNQIALLAKGRGPVAVVK